MNCWQKSKFKKPISSRTSKYENTWKKGVFDICRWTPLKSYIVWLDIIRRRILYILCHLSFICSPCRNICDTSSLEKTVFRHNWHLMVTSILCVLRCVLRCAGRVYVFGQPITMHTWVAGDGFPAPFAWQHLMQGHLDRDARRFFNAVLASGTGCKGNGWQWLV